MLPSPIDVQGAGSGRTGSQPTPGGEPGPSQRPLPLQQAPVGDQQGRGHPRPAHLFDRHAQEVGGRDVVVENDQDGGLRAVVVGGAMGVVVAQVRGQPRRHRDGAHGAALPLQEEGPCVPALAQDAEGTVPQPPQSFGRPCLPYPTCCSGSG